MIPLKTLELGEFMEEQELLLLGMQSKDMQSTQMLNSWSEKEEDGEEVGTKMEGENQVMHRENKGNIQIIASGRILKIQYKEMS